jgi:L-ascorbate metabolism protein UlaG (beta-lactamase superfamily)
MERQPDDAIYFIGNATVLIRYAGFTLLTDPNFIHRGESVPLGFGMSTVRLTDPAMEIEDLPSLDAVVLSHYHGDHFDQVAEERLDRDLPIVTTGDAARQLQDKGFTATVPLQAWETHELSRPQATLRITSLPARHAPLAVDLIMPETMGSCLEFYRNGKGDPGRPDLRMYVTGDTIMYDGISEIARRVPGIDVALIHLGGTRVMGITVTMDAAQGLELLQTIRPDRAVPIHYNDYEAFKSPLEDFVAAVEAAGLADAVRFVAHGESLALTPARA